MRMTGKWARVCASAVLVLLFSMVQTVSAGTIIKLSLGGDAVPDVEFDGLTFGTIDVGGASAGDQDTNIEYSDFLAFLPDAVGSFTLSGLAPVGAPTIGPFTVEQQFFGGSFELFESPADQLLLSGTLTDSVLVGTSSSPGVGAVFTVSFGSFTGGSFAPLLAQDSLTLSMALNDVVTGSSAGLQVVGGVLQPFVADASALIGAIPEPTSVALLGMALVGVAVLRRRR